MRVWHLRDLPQSVCIETGNVREMERLSGTRKRRQNVIIRQY